eukprot:gb/GECG01007549.1/.p1 GENE.gb/GECG01007549.1/~~gb/GECG01007549.1/.p1  ORF type:complete len:184 (+),score=37.82 gb/GECG01007549.1/:1-552(+)
MEYLNTLQSTSAEVNALGALLTDSNGFTIQASGELPLESGPYIRSLCQRAHALAKTTGESTSGGPPVVTIETKDRHITVRSVDDHDQQYSLALISDANQVNAPLKVKKPAHDSQLDHGAKGASGGQGSQHEEGANEGPKATSDEHDEEDDEQNEEYAEREDHPMEEDEEDDGGGHHRRGDSEY